MITSHKNRQLVFPLIYFRNTYKLKTRFNVKRVDTKQTDKCHTPRHWII